MGRLVLQLPDGTSLDIPLDRERVTLGRRADNDVCLPFPAVSGEHAAVVTILDDSFLEDLNSTNGTLVNGRSISKHFLRDGDEIEIGRQKLVYRIGEAPVAAGEDAPVRSGRTVRNPRVASKGGSSGADQHAAAAAKASASHDRSAGPAPPPRPSSSPALAGTLETRAKDASPTGENGAASDAGAPRAGESARVADARAAVARPHASVRIDSGPSAGRVVAMTGERLVIGRVGERIVAVQRAGDGCRLVPLEGEGPLTVNGAAVPAGGVDLRSGDVLVLAGTQLTFSAPR